MELDVWLAFVAASIALLLIPGPTVVLVLSYAITQGRKVAVATAAGVALGDFLAMSASLVGLGALVLTSAVLFTLLKWIGAVYLVYLGVRLYLHPAQLQVSGIEQGSGVAPSRVFTHAAAVTALNPKSIAFFIAFVPQFIDAEAPLTPQFAILIASFVALAALNAMTYALLAERLRSHIVRPSVMSVLNKVGGSALILMGVLTASVRRGTL